MTDALILCRLVHFAAAMLLWGGAVFAGFLAPPDLRAAFAPLGRRVIPALALILAVTTVLWLSLEAGLAADGWAGCLDPSTLAALLGDTAFGHLWLVRMGLITALAGGVIFSGRTNWRWIAVPSGLALASLALTGHAAMREGAAGAGQRLLQALHLLGAGFWLGGLPPLVICLWQLHNRAPATDRQVVIALSRFSAWGHLAVALVIVTGTINAALILGGWPAGLSTPYRQLLLLKITLVAAMVMIALANRYYFVPRLAAPGTSALRAILRGTMTELALGAAALACVSAFALFDPV